jgi:hypothetical protein
LLVAFAFTSCAKQPTQEMDAAKAAIQAVVAAKGDVYAKDELKKLNDDLQVATDEVNAQAKKFFKKYGKAKEMLAKVVTDADAVKALVPARIDEAKNAAMAAQTEAKAAFDEAKALLEKAPKGKGTKADIEAMKADLSVLRPSFESRRRSTAPTASVQGQGDGYQGQGYGHLRPGEGRHRKARERTAPTN